MCKDWLVEMHRQSACRFRWKRFRRFGSMQDYIKLGICNPNKLQCGMSIIRFLYSDLMYVVSIEHVA